MQMLNRILVVSIIVWVVALSCWLTPKSPPVPESCVVVAINMEPLPTESADQRLVNKITSRYKKVSPKLAAEIVMYTALYAKPIFPKQEDLLAVIAVESSFNPTSKSNLKSDPAVGLTQIRPGKHNLKQTDLYAIENQIKYSADILEHNYNRVNSKALALHAYNLGLTAALKGKRSKTYVVKYDREFKALTSV